MNPPSCITALYAKNDQAIGKQCSLSISHMPHTFIPVTVTSNLWINPSKPDTLASTIMIICHDKATSTVPLHQPFYILSLSPYSSVAPRYFHLPLYYEDHIMMINVSLDTTNINAVNISTPYFRILQHFNSNWITPHLQKLANGPEALVAQLYKHIINTSEPVYSFTIMDDDEDQSLIWTVLP